ncbi:MAG: 16S rRNA (adenine(1518)-N(6)/adenine(1519)-N(6))-dimethyltransferase RsmA [Bacteroidetes bacterium]|nr:16S rRNA (adenine(1518)-N(6)/adenine(1519)-N(6))-dimethyltransferase RsmA [Bacteroidota bacterium]MCA6445040.1 16S rRNA (adenine(1518)-N(6)/adenine(1519)-N(6))-dimethyltransferase RsmA [Bacteroidota bacterium]
MQSVKAKKHLGQHFLNDESIAKSIVEALLSVNDTQPVIEIGPGMGVLTKHLLASNVNFKALDVDEESIAYLKENYPHAAEKFLFADFLTSQPNQLFDEKFNVIGNFPYNISSQIMFKVLEHKNDVEVVVGMFQKEVAERIAEKPGSKTYGILSVLLQAFYDIEYLFTVHENVFTPPPKVKSAVIRLKRNKTKQLNCNEKLFVKVVKACFNQRRKMIRNSVQSLLNNKTLQHPLFTQRPEQLSVKEFVDLTNFVEQNI